MIMSTFPKSCHIVYLGAGQPAEEGTRGRAAHGFLLQWSEIEPSVGGNSCMVLWQCWPGTWSGSLSCGGGATGKFRGKRVKSTWLGICSLVPRPHPKKGERGLVNLDRFLGLAGLVGTCRHGSSETNLGSDWSTVMDVRADNSNLYSRQ